MKRFIKKHKNKLFILMLTLISTLTLFLNIGKTYAYKTNEFSYTIDNVSIYNIGSTWQYDSNNHIITSNNTINNSGTLLIQLDFNNSTTINKYLLVNLKVETSQDNVNFNNVSSYSIPTISYLYNYSNMNNSYRIAQGRITYTSINSNNNVYTLILSPNNEYQSNEGSYNNLYFNLNCGVYEAYYKITIVNIDYVSNYEIGLQQYYDTYYGQIEDNYNQLQANYEALQEQYEDLNEEYTNLNTAYNELEDNYNTLENDYNTLDDNYNSLENDYNTLQDNYDSLNNALNNLPQYNGMESFINAFNGATIWLSGYGGTGPIQNSPTYTLQNFNESNFNLSRDTDTFYTWIQNNINTYGGFDIYIELAQPYTTSLSVGFNNLNYNHSISIYATPNGLSIATYGDYDVANNLIIVNPDNYYSYQMLSFSITQNDYDINISSNINGDQYMNGYNNGYNQSLLEWNDDLINARERIQTQNQLITSLQEQISATSQDYNLNNLMWTIASTPFESFKQIWNVNFLGVNITQMVTGLLTAFIVLYIVKKFFL